MHHCLRLVHGACHCQGDNTRSSTGTLSRPSSSLGEGGARVSLTVALSSAVSRQDHVTIKRTETDGADSCLPEFMSRATTVLPLVFGSLAMKVEGTCQMTPQPRTHSMHLGEKCYSSKNSPGAMPLAQHLVPLGTEGVSTSAHFFYAFAYCGAEGDSFEDAMPCHRTDHATTAPPHRWHVEVELGGLLTLAATHAAGKALGTGPKGGAFCVGDEGTWPWRVLLRSCSARRSKPAVRAFAQRLNGWQPSHVLAVLLSLPRAPCLTLFQGGAPTDCAGSLHLFES